MRGFNHPTWNKLAPLFSCWSVLFLPLSVPYMFLLPIAQISSQNKKINCKDVLFLSESLSAGSWVPGSYFGVRKSLTVSFWRYPTLFSWYNCWAVNAVKENFFTLLHQSSRIYFSTAGVFFFFLNFSAFLPTAQFLSYGLVLWPVFL